MIIYLRGTKCAGKSWVLSHFSERPDVAIWDVLDFYIQTGAVDAAGQTNWRKWQLAKDRIVGVLRRWLSDNKGKICFVEGSSNESVSRALAGYDYVDIVLDVPDRAVLRERAEMRGLTPKSVFEHSRNFRRKIVGVSTVSQNVALHTLEEFLDENGNL